MSGSADTVFSAAQYDAAYPRGVERHWWMLARTWIVDRLLGSAAVPDGEVLEVGCGTGVVVAALRSAGHDCRGVELATVQQVPGALGYVRTACDAVELPAEERARVRTILLLDAANALRANAARR